MSRENWFNFTEAVKKLVADCTIIQYEYDVPKKPVVNTKEVRFNGIGEDGHETFMITRVTPVADYLIDKKMAFGFCKTAYKPYDEYVTACLILAKHFLKDEIRIGSDGDVSDWQAGVRLINEKADINIEMLENDDAEYPSSVGDSIIREDVKLDLNV